MSKMKLALDVVKDLRSLADSIETLVDAIVENQIESEEVTTSEPAKPKSKSKANKKSELKEVYESKEVVETKNEPDPTEVKQPTLEELRASMADKNRAGHREEVKAILLKYGANKLTALEPAHYAQVLKEAEEIK